MTKKVEIEVLSTGKLGAKIAVYVGDEAEPLVFNLTSRSFRTVNGYAMQEMRGDVVALMLDSEPTLNRGLHS